MAAKLGLLAILSTAALTLGVFSGAASAAEISRIGFDHDGGAADINAGPMTGSPGDFVTISLVVEVEDGAALGAWRTDVLYSDMVLDATACTSYVPGAGSAACNPDFSPNVVRLSGADLGGVTGVFKLMDITFQLIGPPGYCSVMQVQDDTLIFVDTSSNPLDPPILPTGEICVAGTEGRIGFDHDEGAADINSGPASVPAGGSVSVDVVAELPPLGLKAWSFNVSFDPAVLDATACTPHPASACNPDFDASTARSAGAHLAGLFGVQELLGVTFTAVGAPGTCSDLTITLDEYGTVVAPGESEPFIEYTPEILLGRICVVAAESCADVTGDGRVRLVDVARITLRALFGPYNARFDLNSDGVINFADVRIAIGQLGTTCQP